MFAAVLALQGAWAYGATSKPDYIPDEIIIKLKKSVLHGNGIRSNLAPDDSRSRGRLVIDSLDQLGNKSGVIRSERLFKFGAEKLGRGENVGRSMLRSPDPRARDFDPDLYRRLAFKPGVDVKAVVKKYKKDPNVEFAELNYIRRPNDNPSDMGAGEGSLRSDGEVSRTDALPSVSVSDPLAPQQWHLQSINAPQAWSFLQSHGINPGGSRDVIVAVIDTGVDYTHPDLAGNMWVNSAEIRGNGIDDDGNGFVDDYYGPNIPMKDTGSAGDPMDDMGHGTHVAGIVAAQGNNANGGVGVAYNVQIMAIKAAQYGGVFTSSDIASAVLYAIDKGATVINMSFGGYGRSQVEEDALAVAFGQSVLVAAAGNDGLPNQNVCGFSKNMYPASYPWVMGVMASTSTGELAPFSNYDCIPKNTVEYEVAAPGSAILSTLPGGQYDAWSGTSMAAPVVSGIAALVRSHFTETGGYSSRFIMGQLVGTAPKLSRGPFNVADAYLALSTAPKPDPSLEEHYVFDSKSLNVANDGDGRIDAGETIDIGILIRNHWGKADNVTVKIRAWNGGVAGDDPFVTISPNTVDYGAVSTFNTDDNGLVRDAQGKIVGVENPFRITVASNCPNDHIIPIYVEMTATNGYDPTQPPMVFSDRFELTVQRGVELPRFISEDTTLTKDNYYIVSDAVLVNPGVTLTVEPGTRIQFWGSNAVSPYQSQPDAKIFVQGRLLVNGTESDPAVLFPSPLWGNRMCVIEKSESGRIELNYARITNPHISGAQLVNHCYFDQSHDLLSYWYAETQSFGNAEVPKIDASEITHSIFHKMGDVPTYAYPSRFYFYSAHSITHSLFDSSSTSYYSLQKFNGNVLLKNVRDTSLMLSPRYGKYMDEAYSYFQTGWSIDRSKALKVVLPTVYNGHTYFTADGHGMDNMVNRRPALMIAEEFARHLGGHVATITDGAENDFLMGYFSYRSLSDFKLRYPDLVYADHTWGAIGLNDWETPGVFEWLSGEPVSFLSWQSSHPMAIGKKDGIAFVFGSGEWFYSEQPAGYIFAILLEVPGEWSQGQLDAAREEFLFQAAMDTNGVRNNAILNSWLDPTPSRWLSVESCQNGQISSSRYTFLNNNYWGMTSLSLIKASIRDFDEDMKRDQVVVEPMLTEPPADCYPFVADVKLSTSGDPNASVVGSETVTFTVTFNRPMDQTVQPQVSFGPDTPWTDFSVHGDWVDAKTWRGTFTVTPVTGDGYQVIRVAGARAADDAWLVTGDDSERFHFEIVTSGAESMRLQANGREGRVDLTWSQDDFDLLAGYHLYKSEAENGTYGRVNSGIIPKGQLAYADTNVEPGRTYYYKFTVVKTDMSESSFSNVASAKPLDTIPPVISHTPVSTASPGTTLTINANVTDNVAVKSVMLYYRKQGQTAYASAAMTSVSGSRYSANIPGSKVTSPGLEYYITATDGISTTYSARAENPNQIVVVDKPVIAAVSPVKGSASGGTAIAVSGSNFKSGAKVALGGAACGNVIVVSQNQVTCTTAAHFPETVDVVVTNPDYQSGTLLRGFTYESAAASVSIPNAGGAKLDVVRIPVNADVRGLVAADLRVTFSSATLKVRGVITGALTSGWDLSANTATDGEVRVALASTSGAVTGSGVLFYIECEVTGSPGTSTTVQVDSVSLNDGAIPAQTSPGTFSVYQVYNISGKAAFWKTGAGVPGVGLSLVGKRTYTCTSNATGAFSVSGVPAGNYTLSPGKSDGASGITAYDASLVLQHAVGISPLTGWGAVAADVNKSGTINSMDATYILQKAVGLIDVPFPGAGFVWQFDPAQRTYPALSGNRTAQDFTAVLLGDVNGSWAAAGLRQSEESGIETGIDLGEISKEALDRASLDGSAEIVMGEAVPIAHGRIAVPLEIVVKEGKVFAADLRIGYGKGKFRAVAVQPKTRKALVASSLDGKGEIRIALAAPGGLPRSCRVVTLIFESKNGQSGLPRPRVREARLNDDRIRVDF
ncbi:MAG: S8 family serine peptidase [Acidobacteriota bacterium]